MRTAGKRCDSRNLRLRTLKTAERTPSKPSNNTADRRRKQSKRIRSPSPSDPLYVAIMDYSDRVHMDVGRAAWPKKNPR
ncbi:hypothetical protein PTTG_27396 [Puccinia triticina 1-1 BBBD Race 1]|uniref:Uncharacterized protein n=2 Tax=Puccinia triticina TaxID=208348 RepID=A0A180GL96_PUCT1|nr:uncharacterized protein PtA15_11A51 [Puccinia triticina]OAV93239.1 hypothetical protein PTTG_27396 [Puccinia triticina 1-1 BBBD Race 1]WAQ89364.1 hypothetical protein PtA15_11A51 [Puccinia triticina]WAR59413.1 hypothetical protein PtB15_11B53 [Puccinia triticina]